MYYTEYQKLSDTNKNLANYFEFIKNNAILSTLNEAELISIINNYELDICYSNKTSRSYLHHRIMKHICTNFTDDENIIKLEETSEKIIIKLYNKRLNVQKREVTKYKIIELLATQDKILKLLTIDKNKLMNKSIRNLILSVFANRLNIKIDYDSITFEDIIKLKQAIESYFAFYQDNDYMLDNYVTYSIVNTYNTTLNNSVKKLKKQM